MRVTNTDADSHVFAVTHTHLPSQTPRLLATRRTYRSDSEVNHIDLLWIYTLRRLVISGLVRQSGDKGGVSPHGEDRPIMTCYHKPQARRPGVKRG
jgi:hypothetical protein